MASGSFLFLYDERDRILVNRLSGEFSKLGVQSVSVSGQSLSNQAKAPQRLNDVRDAETVVLLISPELLAGPAFNGDCRDVLRERIANDQKTLIVHARASEWERLEWLRQLPRPFGDLTLPSLGEEKVRIEELVRIARGLVDFETEELSHPRTDEAEQPAKPAATAGTLSRLSLNNVGPSSTMEIEFKSRFNLITGDNGLGKTFLLECAWWAITGVWSDEPVYPRNQERPASISFERTDGQGNTLPRKQLFERNSQSWPIPDFSSYSKGLAVYARVDGTFAAWDPARHEAALDHEKSAVSPLNFTRDQIWDGLRWPGQERTLCNGLFYDWAFWMADPASSPLRTFESVLATLSPAHDPGAELKSAGLTKQGADSRMIPALHSPHGPVPLKVAAASVQRIVNLAYLVVWAWESHLEACRKLKAAPHENMIVLIDEPEAHLHPQWQRSLMASFAALAGRLSDSLNVQWLAVTHSPLVLASLDGIFSDQTDALFSFGYGRPTTASQTGQSVPISEPAVSPIEYAPHGTSDGWFTSSAFNLEQPRSLKAERVINRANELMLADDGDDDKTPEQIRKTNEELKALLSGLDEFWAYWAPFASDYMKK